MFCMNLCRALLVESSSAQNAVSTHSTTSRRRASGSQLTIHTCTVDFLHTSPLQNTWVYMQLKCQPSFATHRVARSMGQACKLQFACQLAKQTRGTCTSLPTGVLRSAGPSTRTTTNKRAHLKGAVQAFQALVIVCFHCMRRATRRYTWLDADESVLQGRQRTFFFTPHKNDRQDGDAYMCTC
jgi:hypothetical protein